MSYLISFPNDVSSCNYIQISSSTQAAYVIKVWVYVYFLINYSLCEVCNNKNLVSED